MEKFTHYRDAATGIQPFLTPTPPLSTGVFLNALLPFRWLLGLVRCALLVAFLLAYILFVGIFANFLRPIGPLFRLIRYAFTAFISRATLFILGIGWVETQIVSRTRTRGATESWRNPSPGDVVVSNSISWIEMLWLAWRFDSTFVRAVVQPPSRTPGTPNRGIRVPVDEETVILGFSEVSLLSMITSASKGPIVVDSKEVAFRTFDSIRKNARGPVVIFPELTTSNGRAILQFAPVFTGVPVPVRSFQVYVMCVKYDAPTELRSSLSHTIPTRFNPVSHIWTLATSLTLFQPFTVRFLALSESPSSPTMKVSEFIKATVDDELSEICASLISQIGKMKRIQQSWQSKLSFLEFYNAKR